MKVCRYWVKQYEINISRLIFRLTPIPCFDNNTQITDLSKIDHNRGQSNNSSFKGLL